MVSSYVSNQSINTILYAALRKVNGYIDGELPDSAKLEEAREAFNNILADMDSMGIRYYKRMWRTKVFNSSSEVSQSGSYYRCILPHTSISALTWVAKTSYSDGDKVYPSTYNGFYYQAATSSGTGGISAVSEPSFPSDQDETVTDETATVWSAAATVTSGDVYEPTARNGYLFKATNSGTTGSTEPSWDLGGNDTTDNDVTWAAYEIITWTAKPDNKPGLGKDWRTYWFLDSSITSASAWAINTEYRVAGSFDLLSDEYGINRAFIRQGNWDREVTVYEYNEYQLNEGHKENKGVPCELYIESVGKTTVKAHVKPIPSLTGADGYVLHYEAYIKNERFSSNDSDSDIPDLWNRFFIFQLSADLSPEYSVDLQREQAFQAKANDLFKRATKSDSPKVSRRFIKPCY